MTVQLWTGSDPRAAALVVPTVEVISGQSEFMIPCTAAARAEPLAARAEPPAAGAVRAYYWMFNGTYVTPGTTVRPDGGLQFSEIRPEQTGISVFLQTSVKYVFMTS